MFLRIKGKWKYFCRIILHIHQLFVLIGQSKKKYEQFLAEAFGCRNLEIQVGLRNVASQTKTQMTDASASTETTQTDVKATQTMEVTHICQKEIIRKRARSRCQATQTTATHCICQKEDHGWMVECENKDCPIGWFHYTCVGLKKAPKGEWLCLYCALISKK